MKKLKRKFKNAVLISITTLSCAGMIGSIGGIELGNDNLTTHIILWISLVWLILFIVANNDYFNNYEMEEADI